MVKRSEIQQLERIIKEQKATIKELKKIEARHKKRDYLYQDLEDRIAEEIHKDAAVVSRQEVCPECNKDTLELIDLKARKMITCRSCGYRKIRK
jgi:hypothetical protein